jgi:hypothetical protein
MPKPALAPQASVSTNSTTTATRKMIASSPRLCQSAPGGRVARRPWAQASGLTRGARSEPGVQGQVVAQPPLHRGLAQVLHRVLHVAGREAAPQGDPPTHGVVRFAPERSGGRPVAVGARSVSGLYLDSLLGFEAAPRPRRSIAPQPWTLRSSRRNARRRSRFISWRKPKFSTTAYRSSRSLSASPK